MSLSGHVILPSLPVLIPLLAGIVSLLVYRSVRAQAVLGVVSLLANAAAAGALLWTVAAGAGEAGGLVVSQMGNWPAPFGITLAVDALSAGLLCVTAIVAAAAYVFVLGQTSLRFASGYFHPLYQLLVLGVNWAFITGDLFNLFVSFEVMLMASYVLLSIGTTARQMRQAYKYVLLNVFASTVFVAACGWIYGNLGTLNLAELAHLSMTGQMPPGTGLAVAALALVFAAKSAVFPLWFWLPDTYPTLPAGLGALYAALLTKVGIYALLRVLLMCFGESPAVSAALGPVLLVAAGATMLLGGLGMAGAATLRGMLSCGILVGVGYMLAGIGLAMQPARDGISDFAAVTGAVFYMLQHMLVIAALLLCGDVVEGYAGTDLLSRLGGLLGRNVWLAVLFFIAAMSLVGLPPTSGFPGKLLLIRAGFERGDAWGWIISLLIIAASVLTLVAMGRAWCGIFWSTSPAETPSRRLGQARSSFGGMVLLAPALLVAVSVAVGLLAARVQDLAESAARNVLEPEPYIRTVLGSVIDNAPHTGEGELR